MAKKDLWVDNKELIEVCKNNFEGSCSNMAKEFGYLYNTMTNYLADGGKAPPHLLKHAKLYKGSLHKTKEAALKTYLVAIPEDETKYFERSIEVSKGDFQVMKFV